MFLRLLLLLTIVPIAELFVLLQVHGAIASRFDGTTALLITFGAILGTGMLGAFLARTQGLGVLRGLQQSMSRGEFPGGALIDGALVLLGGALLLTPGFLTDLAGLSLLIPGSRALWRRGLSAWVRREIGRGAIRVDRFEGARPRPSEPGEARVIDVTPEDEAL